MLNPNRGAAVDDTSDGIRWKDNDCSVRFED